MKYFHKITSEIYKLYKNKFEFTISIQYNNNGLFALKCNFNSYTYVTKGIKFIMIKNKRKLLLYLLIVPAYLIVIYLFSHQTGYTSNEISEGMIRRVVGKLFSLTGNELTGSVLDSLNLIFRKLLHFTEYMILAMLFYSMLKCVSLSINRRLTFSILPAVLYSASDEFHQLFVPNRTAKFTDILIDSSGVIVGALLMYYAEKRKVNKYV